MNYLYTLIIAMLLNVIIVITSLFSVIFDTHFFNEQFVQLGSYERQPTVMEEAKKLMQYRINKDTYIDTAVYTQNEIHHLHDVKQLLHKTVFFIISSIILLIIIHLTTKEKSKYTRIRKYGTIRGIIFFTTTIGGIILLSLIDFDTIFTQFHLIFFEDNRQFPGTSFLIESYPEDFFANAAIQRVFRATIMRLLSYVWVFYIYKHPRHTTKYLHN